jgi:hypothetical protein
LSLSVPSRLGEMGFTLSNLPFYLHIVLETVASVGLLFGPQHMLSAWHIQLDQPSGRMCQEESFVVFSTIIAAVYALYLPSRSQARYVMAWICFPFHIFSGTLLPLFRTLVMQYPSDNLPETWAFSKMVIGVCCVLSCFPQELIVLRFRFMAQLRSSSFCGSWPMRRGKATTNLAYNGFV